MIEEIDTRDDDLMIKYLVQKSLPLFSLWESHLTLPGAKLVDVYIAKINSHDESTREVTFYKKELEEILERERINASELKPVLEHLMDKFAIAEIVNGKKQYVLINLFELCKMEYDENGVTFIRMKCSETAKKYFFNIEALKYRKYNLKEIAPLKSIYTYNMFLILQLYRWNKHFKLTLSKLRERLGVVKSKEVDPKNKDKNVFQEFKRLNDQVLKVTQEELAERVDFKFTYELVKTGKNVASVIFHLDLPEQENKKPTKQKAKVANNKQTLPPPSSLLARGNDEKSVSEPKTEVSKNDDLDKKEKFQPDFDAMKTMCGEKPASNSEFNRWKNWRSGQSKKQGFCPKAIRQHPGYKKFTVEQAKLFVNRLQQHLKEENTKSKLEHLYPEELENRQTYYNRREDENFDDCDEFKEKLRV